MKKIIYAFLFIFGVLILNSCEEDLNDVYNIKDGSNLVAFQFSNQNIGMTADGSESTKQIQIKVVGHGIRDVSGDISVTVAGAANSTAIEGDHYRIENPTITLSASNNYLGIVELIMMSEGNSAPPDGTPEFDEYEAPILYLEITNVSGDASVIASGKPNMLTLNFTPPNPYAGDYVAHMIYRHPGAGDYPDNINWEGDQEKTLTAVTGRKCETWFAIWPTVPCWITVNPDNSINFEVDSEAWADNVSLGDPNRPDLVSHFDPDDGKIYLYYHYTRASGSRIFWEEFTPQFK